MSTDVLGSRFPVGSSASRTSGLFTHALAIETRCCSPPESSSGIGVQLFPQTDVLEDLRDALVDHVLGLADHLERERDVLESRLVLEELVVLEDRADVPAQVGNLERRDLRKVLAGNEHVSTARLLLLQKEADHRGFPGAGRAHDEDELALVDLDRDVFEGGDAVPVDLGDALKADHGVRNKGLERGRLTLPEVFREIGEGAVVLALVDAADASRLAPRAARRMAFWLGPVLITGSVLFALRGFLFGGGLTNQHPDLLTFWLPRWSFLGESVAAGRIPLWNPFEMAGYRFAADPQSGWLYAPPMLLFSVFSPGPALRLFIVCNPLLAGLAMYVFLRKESIGRAAAAAGGLVLAMMMSTSTIAISLPFAGALAWTAVLLVAASGYRRAEGWSGRCGWLALGAFAWMQVAAAHLSHGLVIATAFVTIYLVAGAVADSRAGIVAGRSAAGRVTLFLLVLPLAALPILVPHVDFLGESSLRGGYGALGDTGQSEVGDPLGSNGVWAAWPLGFAAAPGAYAGAVALACALLAARARRLRTLVIAIGGLALAAYALTSPLLVTAGWFRASVLRIPFGDVYLHNPGRLRYVAVLALPILAAAGLQGLVERPLSPRAAIAWLGAAALTFVAWPLLAGGSLVRFAMVAAILVAAAPLLYGMATRRWRWASASAVVGVLTVELLASAVYAQSYEGGTIFTGLETGDHPSLVAAGPSLPDAGRKGVSRRDADRGAHPSRARSLRDVGATGGLLREGLPLDEVAGRLAGARTDERLTLRDPGRPGLQPRAAPPLLAIHPRHQRALGLLQRVGAQHAVRRGCPSSGIAVPGRPDGIGASRRRRDRRATQAATRSGSSRIAQPLATSSGGGVRYADDLQHALDLITAPGFDPSTVTIVERSIGVTPPLDLRPVAPTVEARSPTEIRIRMDPPGGGVLTIRNAYEAGWRAVADGRGRRRPCRWTDSSKVSCSPRARVRSSSPTTTTR